MAIANDIEHVLGAFSGVAMDATVAVDAKIARLATAQHGVVAARQLLALGVGRRAVQHRIACGRLIRLYRGVFAIGHARLTRHGRWMAAVLAAGPAPRS